MDLERILDRVNIALKIFCIVKPLIGRKKSRKHIKFLWQKAKNIERVSLENSLVLVVLALSIWSIYLKWSNIDYTQLLFVDGVSVFVNTMAGVAVIMALCYTYKKSMQAIFN